MSNNEIVDISHADSYKISTAPYVFERLNDSDINKFVVVAMGKNSEVLLMTCETRQLWDMCKYERELAESDYILVEYV
jgi:hypothetical protein